jgi:hypothetical protein
VDLRKQNRPIEHGHAGLSLASRCAGSGETHKRGKKEQNPDPTQKNHGRLLSPPLNDGSSRLHPKMIAKNSTPELPFWEASPREKLGRLPVGRASSGFAALAGRVLGVDALL